jgi:hypothetical protein
LYDFQSDPEPARNQQYVENRGKTGMAQRDRGGKGRAGPLERLHGNPLGRLAQAVRDQETIVVCGLGWESVELLDILAKSIPRNHKVIELAAAHHSEVQEAALPPDHVVLRYEDSLAEVAAAASNMTGDYLIAPYMRFRDIEVFQRDIADDFQGGIFLAIVDGWEEDENLCSIADVVISTIPRDRAPLGIAAVWARPGRDPLEAIAAQDIELPDEAALPQQSSRAAIVTEAEGGVTERIDILVLRHGRVDFEALLSEQNIGFRPGEKLGSIQVIQIVEPLAPIATALSTVLGSWLRQRRGRRILLQLKDKEFVEMKADGFSVEQVETIVDKIRFISVSQMRDDDYRFEDDYSSFEEHLLQESGKRRSFNVSDVYEARQKSSAYFRNKASDMHAGAVVIWDAYQKSPSSGFEWDHEAVRLGLEDPPPESRGSPKKGMRLSFSLHVALPPVFALLAGLSIELQIKAIGRLLDLENRNHHRIADLSKHVGITLSSENAAFADALSEYVYWASRYPTPRNEAQFDI